jgi:hypothetical protein
MRLPIPSPRPPARRRWECCSDRTPNSGRDDRPLMAVCYPQCGVPVMSDSACLGGERFRPKAVLRQRAVNAGFAAVAVIQLPPAVGGCRPPPVTSDRPLSSTPTSRHHAPLSSSIERHGGYLFRSEPSLLVRHFFCDQLLAASYQR